MSLSSICMKTIETQTKPTIWHREVRASFRKVVAFDLLFYGLGVITGIGITAAILLS
ncbi:MAG TPA: hypothetical protein VD699_00385 [Nitrosopumilaceae archaeon]|nr:hypothetical protein [Nitrosopumilaceae archaeon]